MSLHRAFALDFLTALPRVGLHPPVGMMLERYVPKGGITMGEQYFPEGTIVGINAWLTASVTLLLNDGMPLNLKRRRDKKVYGSDPDDFRPERWLEASKEELAAMERANFAVRGFPHRGLISIKGKKCKLTLLTSLATELENVSAGASPCLRCPSWFRSCYANIR